jgi:hypothetical protein
VIRGSWFVVRGSWFVVHGSSLVVGDSSLIVGRWPFAVNLYFIFGRVQTESGFAKDQ